MPDNEKSRAATKSVLLKLLHFIARKRLTAGKLTLVDATNAQRGIAQASDQIAREFPVCRLLSCLICLSECVARDCNKARRENRVSNLKARTGVFVSEDALYYFQRTKEIHEDFSEFKIGTREICRRR